MDGQLLLLPSENSRPDNGSLQGSQGLLQTLLDLGESFLASEIGEDDLQDLEAKLSAARSRDYGTIRDLQKKIEELSGVSAMMNRLKNELREEKEKAKEEAEDLTQEMAELRYQLMERVDEECELRARTEEASLRRISELEAQLKHAWQETSILLGRKQSAEAQAQARALELEHLKSAFEAVQANDFNIDAVVAAKLQQLDHNLKNFQFAEAELRAERAELASQVVWLQAKLEEAERELEAENEQHVVALIQYEEERGLLEAELEAGKQALHMRNTTTVQTAGEREVACREDMGLCLKKVVCCEAEQKQMEKTVEALKQSIIEKDQVLAAQKEDLLVQKEINKSLMSHSALLDSELLTVRKELLLCESQANEMGSTIANLQEALLLERMKTAEAQEDTNLQTRRLSRQDEEYLHLKTSFDGLVSNLETVQMNLADSRKREREASAQVKKLGLELSLAKQEVVKSEVRLQRALKQKEEQLDAERGKLETAIAAQKQAEWHLHKQTEEVKSSEGERIELQRLLGQVRGTCDQLERERDDLKVAYAELENQFSKRRTAFAR